MTFGGAAKPEYIFRPAQLLRRIRNRFAPARGAKTLVRLPWGWPIEVRPEEVIGRSILNLGVYDLALSELLWRLCDPGEIALDVGANCGYATALLAFRAGGAGRVWSFEAHPEIAEELEGNVRRWTALPAAASVQIRRIAVSDRAGKVALEVPGDFQRNRGISRVSLAPDRNGTTLEVNCDTLDAALKDMSPAGVAKLDVEGHEEAVLRGAEKLLRSRTVRDWVFEHEAAVPSPVTELFEARGYTLFEPRKGFFGPELLPAGGQSRRSAWEPRNLLATVQPERARARFRAGGWQVLSGKLGNR